MDTVREWMKEIAFEREDILDDFTKNELTEIVERDYEEHLERAENDAHRALIKTMVGRNFLRCMTSIYLAEFEKMEKKYNVAEKTIERLRRENLSYKQKLIEKSQEKNNDLKKMETKYNVAMAIIKDLQYTQIENKILKEKLDSVAEWVKTDGIEKKVVGVGFVRFKDEEDMNSKITYCSNGCWKMKGDTSAYNEDGKLCETDDEDEEIEVDTHTWKYMGYTFQVRDECCENGSREVYLEDEDEDEYKFVGYAKAVGCDIKSDCPFDFEWVEKTNDNPLHTQ